MARRWNSNAEAVKYPGGKGTKSLGFVWFISSLYCRSVHLADDGTRSCMWWFVVERDYSEHGGLLHENVDSIQAPWSVRVARKHAMHVDCNPWNWCKPDADGGWFLAGKPRGRSLPTTPLACLLPAPRSDTQMGFFFIFLTLVRQWVSAPASATWRILQVVGFGREGRRGTAGDRAWPRLPGPCWPPSGILPSYQREDSEKRPTGRSNPASVTLTLMRASAMLIQPLYGAGNERSSSPAHHPSIATHADRAIVNSTPVAIGRRCNPAWLGRQANKRAREEDLAPRCKYPQPAIEFMCQSACVSPSRMGAAGSGGQLCLNHTWVQRRTRGRETKERYIRETWYMIVRVLHICQHLRWDGYLKFTVLIRIFYINKWLSG